MHLLLNGITGHRGNSRRYPENSIPAFQSAIRLGVDFIELDIHYTRDGHLVVIHNDTTEATADRNLTVADATLQELKQLRLRQGQNLTDITIPTLEEVFQILGPGCPVGISIQPKLNQEVGSRAIDEVMDMARRLDMLQTIAFNDGQLELMRHVKKTNPRIPVFYDTSEGSDQEIQDALDAGFETIVNYKGTTTPQWVQKVLRNNLIPGVWNISDMAEYTHFKAMGIRRFYADFQEEILACL